MGIMDKVMAATGIDGVRIDAKLDNDVVRIGDTITGRLVIRGGRADQTIQGLEAVLACDATQKMDDQAVVGSVALESVKLQESFTIGAGQTEDIAFEIPVPVGTPVDVPHRRSKSSVYVLSAADVSLGRDPNDLDRVTVRPAKVHEDVQTVMADLGFRFKEGEVEKTRHGAIQEFEFVPGRAGSRYDEVEIAFVPDGQDYALVVETDLSANTGLGLMSAVLDADLDETKQFVRLGGGADGPGRDQIKAAIQRCL
jgi:sporulation-control protein